jgi:hypothetical protein
MNTVFLVDSEEFWRWCATLRIAGFMDFVQRSEFQMLENKVSDTGSLSGEGRVHIYAVGFPENS